jgi:hypothetical protein
MPGANDPPDGVAITGRAGTGTTLQEDYGYGVLTPARLGTIYVDGQQRTKRAMPMDGSTRLEEPKS